MTAPEAGVRDRLLRELWGRDARYYELAREQVLGAAGGPTEYDFLRRHLPERGRVLEVGCGEGSNLDVLCRDGLEMLGCDLSPLGLAMARGRAREGGRSHGLIVADAERLPFGREVFQAVFAVSLLEHLPAPERVIDEMIAVLAPGGTLLLVSPQYGGPLGASPCRRSGGASRFVSRLARAHLPRGSASRLDWEPVAPSVLAGDAYEGDKDAVVEPELSSLVAFLRGRGLSVREASSGYAWHRWTGRNGPLLQRLARAFFERLGRWGLPPYRDFGPLVAVAARKGGKG